MAYKGTMNIPIDEINTPAYVIDEDQLIKNAEILDAIRKRTGCKIILALKAFSMFSVFPLLRDYLDGTTSSSLNEARLGAEEFGKEVHIYQSAYRDDEFPQICNYATQISFLREVEKKFGKYLPGIKWLNFLINPCKTDQK